MENAVNKMVSNDNSTGTNLRGMTLGHTKNSHISTSAPGTGRIGPDPQDKPIARGRCDAKKSEEDVHLGALQVTNSTSSHHFSKHVASLRLGGGGSASASGAITSNEECSTRGKNTSTQSLTWGAWTTIFVLIGAATFLQTLKPSFQCDNQLSLSVACTIAILVPFLHSTGRRRPTMPLAEQKNISGEKLTRAQKKRQKQREKKRKGVRGDDNNVSNRPDPRVARKKNGRKRREWLKTKNSIIDIFIITPIAALLAALFIMFFRILSMCSVSSEWIISKCRPCDEPTWFKDLRGTLHSHLSCGLHRVGVAATIEKIAKALLPFVVTYSPVIQSFFLRYFYLLDYVKAMICWVYILLQCLLCLLLIVLIATLKILKWVVPNLFGAMVRFAINILHNFGGLLQSTTWFMNSLCQQVSSALAFRSCRSGRIYIFLLYSFCCASFVLGLEEEEDEENDDDGLYGFHFGGQEGNQEWSRGQHTAFVSALKFCLGIATELFNTNQLFVPSTTGHWSAISGAFVSDNLAMLGDTNNSVIYTFGMKVGHALKGKIRKKMGYPNVLDRIFVVFNLDHQRGDTHRNLVTSIINFCKQFCHGISPSNLAGLTIEDAIHLEATGLPFFARLFFYTVAYSANECSILGGGRAIHGFLRRLLLFCTESGVQQLFPALGIQLDESTMPYEFITGYGLLDWVKSSHEECVKCGEAFFEKLKTMFGELNSSTDDRVNGDGTFIEYVLKNCVQMIELSSWKPNTKCLPLTEVFLNLIFGTYWSNAFGGRMTHPNYPYDAARSYTDADRNFAFRNFEAFMESMEKKFASFGALDTNSEMLKAPLAGGRTLEEILTRRGWKYFFNFKDFGLDIVVYFFQEKDRYWPSFIFIHGPPCFAFNTESNTLSWPVIELMRQRAVELHLLFLFSRRFLQEKMVDGFNISRDLAEYTVLYNILMAHAMFQYMVANFHLGTKTACLFAKNMIVSFNAFLENTNGYTNGLFSNNCSRGIISKAARAEIERTNSSGRTDDHHVQQTVLNIFSRCFSMKCPVENLHLLTVEEGYSMAIGVLKGHSNRWKYFMKKNVLGSDLLKGLTRAWRKAAGGTSEVAQNKVDEAEELMEDVREWPSKWPKALNWKKNQGKWELTKRWGKVYLSWSFQDTKDDLLAALNVLNRYNEMYKLKKDAINEATDEEKREMRKVMKKHCIVKNGETCDCSWCQDSDTKKRKRT